MITLISISKAVFGDDFVTVLFCYLSSTTKTTSGLLYKKGTLIGCGKKVQFIPSTL